MSSTSDSSAQILLKATELSRQLSETAGVHGISLTLARGDILGLLGRCWAPRWRRWWSALHDEWSSGKLKEKVERIFVCVVQI